MSEVAHRRGTAVAQTVLGATLELLARRGYDFTVEDVAAAADVHKTTIYRRWDTKAHLVAAAITQLADREVATTFSGDPLDDLRVLALQVAAALRIPAGVNALRAALSTVGADPALQTVAAQFLASRYRVATALIERAQQAGVVRADVDPVLVWQAIVNPLHLNAVTGGAVDDRTAGALVDLVLQGARVTDGSRDPR